MSCAPSLIQQRTCTAPAAALSTRSRRARCLKVWVQGDKVDWDKEWKSFGGRRPNVRTTIPVDPSAKLTRDRIKREESILLNAWSSGAFQGAGAAAAVIVLLVVLVAAGPPPADSRCTLPWC